MMQTGAVAIPNRRLVMAPWQVRCLQGYIAAHLHTTIRTADLARVAKLGPFLCRCAEKSRPPAAVCRP